MDEENIRDIDEVLKAHDFIHNLFVKAATLTASSNQFPNAEEINFYKKMPASSEKIKGLSSGLIKKMDKINSFAGGSKWDRTNQTLKFSTVVETLDTFFENVDRVLDKIKNINNEADRFGLEVKEPSNAQIKDTIEKPQITYNFDVDNTELPFVPKLKSKPFAKTPLNNLIKQAQESAEAYFSSIRDGGKKLEEFEFEHPYKYEITNLPFATNVFQEGWKPEKYTQLLSNQHKYINTLEGLKSLIEELSIQKEFAVDVEHHSLRTFHGITCLLQISTRSKDFIVDPFPLWRDLHLLNSVFANPSIVKVFHGSDFDVIWLQRDFGIYIVNMFDTGQAARILGKESFALSYLLLSYCRIIANKTYQLSDWRVRPLPNDMVKYAVEDTHYLLYIYDELRGELVAKALSENIENTHYLELCFNNSNRVALKTFRKQILKNEQYYDLIRRNKPLLSSRKYAIFKRLLKLRHELGKIEDENPKYILSNKILFSIIDRLPKTEEDLLKLFKAGKHLVKKYEKEILEIVNTTEVKEDVTPNENPAYKPIEKEAAQDIIEKLKAVNSRQEESLIKLDFQQEISFPTKVFAQMVISPKPLARLQRNVFLGANKTRPQRNDALLGDIKKSFSYGSSFEYMAEVYPELKESFQAFSVQEKIRKAEDENRRRQLISEETSALNKQNENIDYIELPEIKEKSPPKAIKKDIRLPLDNKLNPLSVKEKYGLNPNYKNKRGKRDFNPIPKDEIRKNLKTENQGKNELNNKFSLLEVEEAAAPVPLKIEKPGKYSDNEEIDSAEEREDERFKQLASKINEKIKSKGRYEVVDPLANLDVMFEKRKFQKNKKNSQKTKFGDKYSRKKF